MIIKLPQPSLAGPGAELGKNEMNLENVLGLGSVLGTIAIMVWFGNRIA